MKKEYNIIDMVKFGAAILVIGIHTSLFYESEIVNFYMCNVVARTAVPFLYICSGYFFFMKIIFSKNGLIERTSQNRKRFLKYIFRLVVLYITWSLIYLVWQIPYWNSIGWTGIHVVKDYLLAFILKGSYYHLWYILSLIYGLVCLYVVLCVIKLKYVIGLSAVLYVIKSIVYGYYWVLPEKLNIVLKLADIFSGIFDGICIAFPFLVMGIIMNQCPRIRGFLCKSRFWGLWISGICLVIEATLLRCFVCGTEKYSYILFTLPLACFMFVNIWDMNLRYTKKVYPVHFRECSTIMYFIHPMIINIAQTVDVYEQFNSTIQFGIVVLCSWLLAELIVWVSNTGFLKILKVLY